MLMIGTIRRPMRGLLAISVALALVAAACGSSSSTPGLGGGGASGGLPGLGGGGASGGNSLTTGMASNLDKLNSYQFVEVMSGSSFGAQASSDSGGVTISGTVINKPDQRLWINYAGTQFIVIGNQQWMSSDGTTWTAAGTGTSAFASFLPGQLYATWFDAFSSGYKSAGDDTQNGIACTHYKGDNSISTLYGSMAGVQGTFNADLWVAKDGGYPVKGVLGYSATAGSQGGTFGYTLDVTHVNDSSNVIAQPSAALPS
jgi:hypothetical protein